MGPASIRPLDDGDGSTAAAVIELLKDHNQQFIGRAPYATFQLVAETASGQLIGGLLGEWRSYWLHVDILVVVPERRGQGVGSALMAAAEQATRDKGYRGLFLDTFDFQAPGFYERLGFSRFGVIQDYTHGYDRHFYEKRL